MLIAIVSTIVPLILTALGFLTYKHPKIARSILGKCGYVFVTLNLIAICFYVGTQKSYYDARDAISSVGKPVQFNFINVDSLESILPHDSVTKLTDANGKAAKVHVAEVERTAKLIQTISDKLDAKKETINTFYNWTMLIAMICWAVGFIFFLLTFTFEKLHFQPNPPEQTTSTDE